MSPWHAIDAVLFFFFFFNARLTLPTAIASALGGDGEVVVGGGGDLEEIVHIMPTRLPWISGFDWQLILPRATQ